MNCINCVVITITKNQMNCRIISIIKYEAYSSLCRACCNKTKYMIRNTWERHSHARGVYPTEDTSRMETVMETHEKEANTRIYIAKEEE